MWKKKGRKILFTDGWYRLREVYNLESGGWVALTYINPNLFMMKVEDRYNRTVQYPGPPIKYKLLPNNVHEGSSAGCSRDANFCHSMVKRLSDKDVTSGKLVCC